ncbi:colicin E1 family microcin immunity protein [Photobacterium sp. GB-1]
MVKQATSYYILARDHALYVLGISTILC